MLKINNIYHKDCFDFLSQVDDESVDLAVIDPPYFLKKAGWDTFKSHTDFLKFTFAWIDALVPKIKLTGSVYIFNTPFNSSFILQHGLKNDLKFRNWITWDKRDGFAAGKKQYVNAQETILFFTKGNKYTFNADDIRVPYESEERMKHAAKKGILKNGKRWFPNEKGRLVGEVWHFSSERHKNKVNGKTPKLSHVTPKPLDMIERIVIASSNPGELVLDCFMGSGTTAVAAHKHNRKYIGSDSNKSYVDFAKKRIKNVKR